MRARTFHGMKADDAFLPVRASPSVGLATALRERTKELHTRAERSGIVSDVLRGQATRYGYALLLRNLLPAYRQMEAGLERHRTTPGVRTFARRELYRTQALESDLRALYGAEWAGSLPLLPAGERYGLRVAAAAENDGTRLLGHAYARYLGDLSGGQILKRLLSKALGFGPHELSFFDFPAIANAEAFKREWRDALDEVAAEISDPDSVVAEAMAAFKLNIAVSESVQAAAKNRC
jgi:heme oxygenase (biliverdin-producing, ferredoxin)